MRISFDRFEFDPATGELSDGTRAERLRPQVAALLGCLLERRGEVVSREMIRREIWGDTTVEFDQAINFAISQLRTALGDDAQAPRFIETLPKRGYRFLAAAAAGQPDLPAASPPRPTRARRWLLVAGSVVAVTVAVALWAAIRSPTRPTLAVLNFDVRGDSAPGRALSLALGELLTATSTADRSLWVIGPASTGGYGIRTPVATIARELGAGLVLSGAIDLGADSVTVFAQLLRAPERVHLWGERFKVVRGTPGAMAEAAGRRIAAGVAAGLGEQGAGRGDRADPAPR